MYTDSGKKFIGITFQSNFKLKFEEIIVFSSFAPDLHVREFFPAIFFLPIL